MRPRFPFSPWSPFSPLSPVAYTTKQHTYTCDRHAILTNTWQSSPAFRDTIRHNSPQQLGAAMVLKGRGRGCCDCTNWKWGRESAKMSTMASDQVLSRRRTGSSFVSCGEQISPIVFYLVNTHRLFRPCLLHTHSTHTPHTPHTHHTHTSHTSHTPSHVRLAPAVSGVCAGWDMLHSLRCVCVNEWSMDASTPRDIKTLSDFRFVWTVEAPFNTA